MGAKGSKPNNQVSTNIQRTTRTNTTQINTTRTNTTRKNTSKNIRRNQTRVNKQPVSMPIYSYGMSRIDCSSYPPPDPEQKVARRKVPNICLEQWEQDIFLQEAKERLRARAAASNPPLPLNLPTITWERIQQAAEGSRDTWYPILFFTTPSNEEYAILDVKAIKDMTQNGKQTYPLHRFFNTNKYELMAFCNYVYDTNVTQQHLEVDKLAPYLILHRVVKNTGESIEVIGFMTIGLYENGIYIGDLCIGPKRGGIGRLTLEQMKALAKYRGFDYVKLEPASNTEPFYEKLGFRTNAKNDKYHIWHPKNGGRRTV